MELPFSPEYPNIQKTIDNEIWTSFVKSKCIVNADAFLSVMNQWVKDPQNVTPPILRAEIIKEDTKEFKENDYTVIKQIRRKIVSRQNRDKNIVQDVKFIKYDNGEYKVIHTPVFNDEIQSYEDFPYYFPPLKKFSYGIIPISNNINCNKSITNEISKKNDNEKDLKTTNESNEISEKNDNKKDLKTTNESNEISEKNDNKKDLKTTNESNEISEKNDNKKDLKTTNESNEISEKNDNERDLQTTNESNEISKKKNKDKKNSQSKINNNNNNIEK
ncbi:hypothetical protein BCR32DRAFT_267609 [Anaeromyces robustus]|uniref:Uncharacterized protein n=1 Tax=Anaeromyces robustus TaxID=1754192 RepID=A0A1Y1X9W2_9FUNG|nr:hypothetical protein BCR32DRAFT_267609 [Anaeromyces robustus]|eukprot:ORX82528.1 hypothetical protein BCR32DRAFT_267609 [Anaeromyces robustus]